MEMVRNEKLSDPGSILKVELTGVPDRMNVGEGRR